MQTKQQSILPLFLVVLSQTFGFRSVISCREHTSVKYLLIRLFICLLADHSHFDRMDKLTCSLLVFFFPHMLLYQPGSTALAITPTPSLYILHPPFRGLLSQFHTIPRLSEMPQTNSCYSSFATPSARWKQYIIFREIIFEQFKFNEYFISLFITQDISDNCTWFLEAGLSHLSTAHLSKPSVFPNHE